MLVLALCMALLGAVLALRFKVLVPVIGETPLAPQASLLMPFLLTALCTQIWVHSGPDGPARYGAGVAPLLHSGSGCNLYG